MTVYADSEFYMTEYLCGKEPAVSEDCFKFYARSAAQKIRQYTGDNIDDDNIPECVKMCCCEIAETLYKSELSAKENAGALSESVGGWSRSYESSESLKKSLDSAVHDIVYKWLSGTGLLYRGVR